MVLMQWSQNMCRHRVMIIALCLSLQMGQSTYFLYSSTWLCRMRILRLSSFACWSLPPCTLVLPSSFLFFSDAEALAAAFWISSSFWREATFCWRSARPSSKPLQVVSFSCKFSMHRLHCNSILLYFFSVSLNSCSFFLWRRFSSTKLSSCRTISPFMLARSFSCFSSCTRSFTWQLDCSVSCSSSLAFVCCVSSKDWEMTSTSSMRAST
mmetsp:Transcript_16958/g.34689  ORF Transcript_16958/g.34689 Transcript_16958/m.34689 type:complete len:210 (+) Transcript_16958:218-847(+)